LLNGIHFVESFGRLEYIRMIDNHGTEVKATCIPFCTWNLCEAWKM
jgi:hypothetical protein